MLSFMSGLESDYILSETLAVCFLRSVKKIFRSSELRGSQFFSMHNSKTSAGRGEWISLLMYQNTLLQEVGTSYLKLTLGILPEEVIQPGRDHPLLWLGF